MQIMNSNRQKQSSRLTRLTAVGAVSAAALIVTGCGAGFNASSSAPAAVAGVKLQGTVFGGQQPVIGATLQLYAANLSGYGATSYPLLTTTVTSGSGGGFNITGDYTCPSATTPVYITATGGSAGSTGTNTGLVLMAALGACGNLTASTLISLNELTTVASAYALAPFMSSQTQLSTSATNGTGLTIAFASVTKLVNIATGSTPGNTLPTGATEPTAELNTLADILASCVNSATGSTACTTLFTNATPAGGTAPTDTLTAILNVAKNPGTNAAGLYSLVSSTAPFVPTLATAPTDFTVAIKYAPNGIFSTPSAAAVDVSGNLWVTNSGTSTLAVLNATTAQPTVYAGGGLSGPSGIAFDSMGNAWVTDKTSSNVSVFTPAGVGTQTAASSLSSPTGVAIDGQGYIWVTNSGSSSLSRLTPSGTTVSATTSYSTGGLNAPAAVAINPH